MRIGWSSYPAIRQKTREKAQFPLSSQPLIEQDNYLAGHKSTAMTKRYDHANEERYGGTIEALDEAGKTGKAEALAAARWKQTD